MHTVSGMHGVLPVSEFASSTAPLAPPPGPQKPLFGGRTTSSRTRLSELGTGGYQGVAPDGAGGTGPDTEIQMQQPQGGGR